MVSFSNGNRAATRSKNSSKTVVGVASSIAIVSETSSPLVNVNARDCKRSHWAKTTFASSYICSPATVNTGKRALRSNKSNPRSASRLLIAVLIRDCALPIFRAAPEKEPCSTEITNALS